MTRLTWSGGSTAAIDDEQGSGLLPTVVGVLCFLLFLLLAAQVLFNLYAASAVQAAAFDAARLVAGADADRARGRDLAEAHMRDVLGDRYTGAHLEVVDLSYDGEQLSLSVRADNPSLLPRFLPPHFGFGVIERTVHVRLERDLP